MGMRTILTLSVLALIWRAPLAYADPPDTSSMPQLLLPQATPVEAASAGPVFTYNVTGATDYVFRGVSQTSNDPAIFGAARVSYDQFYAGVGIENVNFHNSTAAEYDLSGGWAPKIAGFRFDFGVIRYGYINEPAFTHIDTVDFKAAVLHDFGPATLGAAVYYTCDYFGTGHKAVYFEGSATYRITKRLSVGATLGRQTVDDGTDHDTWNAGANYAFTKNIALDLRYYDTDQHRLGTTYKSHYVAALKASF
jgi:uncharacterized protein (TIGR02001 family)